MVVAGAVAGVVVVAAAVVGVVVAEAAAVAAAAAGVVVVVAAAAGISMKRNSTIRKRKLEDSTDYVNTFLKMKQKPAVGLSGVRKKTIYGGTSETTTKRREYSWTTTT
jgi:nitrate reductase gamma subunit